MLFVKMDFFVPLNQINKQMKEKKESNYFQYYF